MKEYRVLKFSTMWSASSLANKVERILNERTHLGWEIVSVSFGINIWYMPTAFITICK